MNLSVFFSKFLEAFSYQADQPLLFNSGQFMLFFILLLLVYVWIFNKVNYRIAWLALFSFFFYYKSSGIYVLLLAAAVVYNYFAAVILQRISNKAQKMAFLVFSIVLNLSALLYFKYTNFFLATYYDLTGQNFDPLDIFLPIGISFFTFQTISYLVDVYKKEIEACDNFIDFAFYLSFFPQLVAGPIVRAKDFIPQIRKELVFSQKSVGIGLFMILKGFVKKAIIADYVAQYVNLVFAEPMNFSGMENLIAMYAYTLQIYCDFSGYSDMAIGLAAVLGFKLPDNFNSPYQALNITDFWRRWHISLSSWLRDYIYIALGGNRGGGIGSKLLILIFMLISMLITGYWWLIWIYLPLSLILWFIARKDERKSIQLFMYINLLLTMLIGGWWHGADWKFVFWGFMHGVGLIVHKIISIYWTSKKNTMLQRFLFGLLTFHFVALLWVYFRAESFELATGLIGKIFSNFDLAYLLACWQARPMVLLFLLAGFGLHFISLKEKQRMQDYFSESPWILKLVVFVIMIQLSIQLQDASVQPFIYFQF